MVKRPVCLAILLAACAAADAGTVVETINRELGEQAGSQTTSLTQVQSGSMRVETRPGDSVMILKGDTLYWLNTREKSYVMIDPAAAKRLAQQINPALRQMQEQMARMPPEQRAQLEKMMGPKMSGLGKQPVKSVRKTTRSDRIGGNACSYVELLEDDKLTDELCVAAPGSLPGSQELLDVARKMRALFEEMFSDIEAPWIKDSIGSEIGNYDKIGGVPILTRHYLGGKPQSEVTLKSIRSEGLPATLFEVPAGYAKKDMMAH